MKDLVADARSGDEFYLHCTSLSQDPMSYSASAFSFSNILVSGHGTQVTDDNGDEEDGMDECMSMFVPF